MEVVGKPIAKERQTVNFRYYWQRLFQSCQWRHFSSVHLIPSLLPQLDFSLRNYNNNISSLRIEELFERLRMLTGRMTLLSIMSIMLMDQRKISKSQRKTESIVEMELTLDSVIKFNQKLMYLMDHILALVSF